MSNAFREFLRKIGSGPHTGESLSRAESATAMRMMLLQEATPAQIGGFMIAHRIRRPTGEELAGMLDAYAELGPQLQAVSSDPVVVMGIPYDGRSRTAPIAPMTALVLATAGIPVIMHGGDRMPTKEGEPLILFWQGLGVDWTQLSLAQVQSVLEQIGVGFVHLPTHFPLAQGLVPYREQIGKRPPLATMELIWCPYVGRVHAIAGFVHPPTEGMFQAALALRGVSLYTTVKGLEGSCDLPRERTAILGLGNPTGFERLHLHAPESGFEAVNAPLASAAVVVQQMVQTLEGMPSLFRQSVVWNGGFYLWRCGRARSLAAGIAQTEELLTSGAVKQTWQRLQEVTTPVLS